MTRRDRYGHLAELLDRFAELPTDALVRTVSGRGRCIELMTTGQPLEITGDPATDRRTATHVCGGCPVQHECLELEMRWPGPQPAHAVFGALSGAERRALLPYWRARRIRRGRGGGAR